MARHDTEPGARPRRFRAEVAPAQARWSYDFVDDWARVPAGMQIGDVGGVAVDDADRVYVFNRGPVPMLVFSPVGELLDGWGEGVFTSPHGLDLAWDGFLYCTDDGDHTVRKFSLSGQLEMEFGTPGVAAPAMSGRPFNRCTHTALSPTGDVFVTDGYRNACVHCFSPQGVLRSSWGEAGSGRRQFHIPHNVVCDEAGIVYVADRENHRIQRFDGQGTWLGEWVGLNRPMAICRRALGGSREVCFYIGEAAPKDADELPGRGPRISVLDDSGRCLARVGDIGAGDAPDRFLAPHGISVDSRGDLYVGEVANAAWPYLYPDRPKPQGLRTLRKLERRVPEKASW